MNEKSYILLVEDDKETATDFIDDIQNNIPVKVIHVIPADSGENVHRIRFMPSSAERSDAGMIIIQSSGRHGCISSELSLGFTHHFEPVGVVDETIQDGVSQSRVRDSLEPAVCWYL